MILRSISKIVQGIGGYFAADIILDGLKDLGKSVFKRYTEETGEQIPKAVKGFITTYFGLDSEDERRYNEAKTLMKPNARNMLSKKLATLNVPRDPVLSRQRYNWFRITCLHENIDVMVAMLTAYALMSKEQWDRECIEMDYKRKEAQNIAIKWLQDRWTSLKAFASRTHGRADTAFTNAIELRQGVRTWSEDAQQRAADL